MGQVRAQVDRALVGVAEDWRTALARSLADALDEEPQASMARELRALMGVIGTEAPAKEGSVVDELAAQRAARLAGTGGPH